MNIQNKQILIISPEPWDGHSVSKHHYAITLAKQGYKVYFLDPPDNSLHDIRIEKIGYENLWSVSSPQVAKGLQYLPKKIRNLLERRWLEKLEKLIGGSFDVVWLFENSRFFNMEFAKDRLKIYHQVDLNQNFHVKEASKSADICFCTTDYIKEEIYPYNEKVFKIHHGVSLAQENEFSREEEKNRFLKDKINVTYVGNLDISYLDLDLLINIIKKHLNITFHLVGNYDENKSLYQDLKRYKNIKWWGRVNSIKIQAILNHSDILLLIYKEETELDRKQLASPHKIMEYLLSGKVIVSTYTDEYKDKRYLLEMVDDSKEFIKKFDEVVNKLEEFNSKEKQQQRIDFAKEHTYEKQLEKIKKLIKEHSEKEL